MHDVIWEIIHKVKSKNHFLEKSNLYLSKRKILILSFERKCVEGAPDNIFVQVSDYCIKFRLCFSQIYSKISIKICIFFTNQIKTEVISSQMDIRMLICIKNQFQINIWIVAWNNDLCAKCNFPVETFKNVIHCFSLSSIETRLYYITSSTDPFQY